MPAVSNAFGFSAEMNVQLWPFLQDLPQLEDVYGKRWMSLLANCGLMQFFTPVDVVTAEYLQRRGGTTTGESSFGLAMRQNWSERQEALAEERVGVRDSFQPFGWCQQRPRGGRRREHARH